MSTPEVLQVLAPTHAGQACHYGCAPRQPIRLSASITGEETHGPRLASISGWLMLSTTGTSLLGLVFWLLCARWWSAEAVGQAGADISCAMLAAAAAGVGLAPAAAQRLLENTECTRKNITALVALTVGLVGGSVAGLLMVLLRQYLSPGSGWSQSDAVAVLLASGCVPLLTVGMVLDSLCVADGKPGVAALRNLGTSAVKLVVLPLVSAGARSGTASIIVPWCFATAIGLLACVFAARRSLHPIAHVSPAQLWIELDNLRKLLGAYQAIGIGGSLWMNALPLLITARLDPRQNAYSAAAWMAAGPLFMLSGSLATAVFVEGKRSPGRLQPLLARATRIILFLLVPCCCAFALAAPRLFTLFGHGYASHSAALVPWLALAGLPDAVTNVATSAMRVRGDLRAAAVLNIAMPLIALALAWLWLPPYGITASAWAWGIGQFCGACAALWWVRRRAALPEACAMAGKRI